MFVTIDAHSGVPAYRQLMDQIRFQIASGVLKSGDELPSTRALSAELALNPMTISKAYGLLERDGVLDRRRGQTLTVADAASDTSRAGKSEHLQRHLRPAVLAARQMGLTNEQALAVFRDLLQRKES